MKHIETAVAKRLEMATFFVDQGVLQAIESNLKLSSKWKNVGDTRVASFVRAPVKNKYPIIKQIVVDLDNFGPSIKYEVKAGRQHKPGVYTIGPKGSKQSVPQNHDIRIEVDFWADTVTISKA